MSHTAYTYTRRTAPAEAAEARAAIDSAQAHHRAVAMSEGNTKRLMQIHSTIAQARIELRDELYNTAKHTAASAIIL